MMSHYSSSVPYRTPLLRDKARAYAQFQVYMTKFALHTYYVHDINGKNISTDLYIEDSVTNVHHVDHAGNAKSRAVYHNYLMLSCCR